MGDQWKGRDGEHLVEEVDGKQVGREGHPHGGAKGEGEKGIKPSLGVLVEAAHVADGVEGGRNPEDRCDGSKKQTRAVHAKEQRHVGKDLPDLEFQDGAAEDRRDHGEDHRGLDACRNEGKGVSRRLGRFSPAQTIPSTPIKGASRATSGRKSSIGGFIRSAVPWAGWGIEKGLDLVDDFLVVDAHHQNDGSGKQKRYDHGKRSLRKAGLFLGQAEVAMAVTEVVPFFANGQMDALDQAEKENDHHHG